MPYARLMSTSSDIPAGPPTTFAQGWELWLAYRRAGARPLRDSTLADYRSIYRRHLEPALGAILLTELNGATIAHFTITASTRGVSPKRLSNILVPLRACLRWHYRIGTRRDGGKLGVAVGVRRKAAERRNRFSVTIGMSWGDDEWMAQG